MNWLILPILSTAFNVLIFFVILQHGGKTRVKADQIPALQEAGLLANSCLSDDSDHVCSSNLAQHDFNKIQDGNDPVLQHPAMQKMPAPNADFVAYVRPDIATFYGKQPGTMTEQRPRFNGQAGKFVNLSPDNLSLYWDSGSGPPGRLIQHIGAFASGGTATFPGHNFYLAPKNDPEHVLCRCNVVKDTSVYFFDPYSDDEGEPGRCTVSQRGALDSLSDEERDLYEAHRYNIEFGELYKNFTGGEWLTMYPKSRPRHLIWEANQFGQEHVVQTKETQFLELPPQDELEKLPHKQLGRNETDSVPLQQYRSQDSVMNMTLKAVSCAPKAFEIQNFLSDVEADHIIDIALKKNLRLSTTGSGSGSNSAHTDTRSSKNTWVGRESSQIVDAVYRRAADAVRMDEALLRFREADEYPDLGTPISIAEDLQLVHYDVGEQYTAHHDFGFPDGSHPESPSRSINVLLYLNEGMEGGETSFPRWRNAETSGSFDVTPEKGKAVIFYMLLPDGNRDDLTQHAALPIQKGEKWLANLWIHDPFRT